jgi:hypothetical protein
MLCQKCCRKVKCFVLGRIIIVMISVLTMPLPLSVEGLKGRNCEVVVMV